MEIKICPVCEFSNLEKAEFCKRCGNKEFGAVKKEEEKTIDERLKEVESYCKSHDWLTLLMACGGADEENRRGFYAIMTLVNSVTLIVLVVREFFLK